MGASKTSGHIQIKVPMQIPSQEPPAPIKAQNQDLKDMNILWTFKIKIESQKILNFDESKTGEHIQTLIKI